jgi:hypothetical protein
MNIERIDQVVLTVTNIQQTSLFCEAMFGFKVVTFHEERTARP